MSVYRPHPEKWLNGPFFPDTVYVCGYADPDTDDRNSPIVFQLVPFLSGYGCADTDTDTEPWNSGLTLDSVVALCYTMKLFHCKKGGLILRWNTFFN